MKKKTRSDPSLAAVRPQIFLQRKQYKRPGHRLHSKRQLLRDSRTASTGHDSAVGHRSSPGKKVRMDPVLQLQLQTPSTFREHGVKQAYTLVKLKAHNILTMPLHIYYTSMTTAS